MLTGQPPVQEVETDRDQHQIQCLRQREPVDILARDEQKAPVCGYGGVGDQ